MLGFSWAAVVGNMSWQHVNSLKCIMFGDVWVMGTWGCCRWGDKMVGLVGAIHVHVVEMHVHCSNHSNTMLSWGRES